VDYADRHDPSRRDFLAASAMGLMAIARDSERPALRDEAQTDGDLIYVGTYTDDGLSDGIYFLHAGTRCSFW